MKGSVSRYEVAGRKPGSKVARYRYVVDLGRDPETGKRIQRRRQGFEREKDAEKAMRDQIRAVEVGKSAIVRGRKMTVGEWLDRWLEYKATSLKSTTLNSYRGHVELYLKPYIGHIKLDELDKGHIAEALRKAGMPKPVPEIRTRGAHKSPRVAGPATQVRIRATLSSALKSAVAEGLLPFNPVDGTERPKTKRTFVEPWTRTELGAFLQHAHGEPDGVLFELAAKTGLRRGEVVGLRWSDVDLVSRWLTVRQTVVEHRGNASGPNCATCGDHHGSVAFDTPKSETGFRRVKLVPELVGSLMEHKLAQDALRDANHDVWLDHDLVFPRADGSPQLPSTVSARFAELAEGAGLRKVRFHDLRHGFVSILIERGVSLATISKIVGHSSIQLTVDVYGHIEDRVKGDVVDEAFSEAFGFGDTSVTLSGDSAPPNR